MHLFPSALQLLSAPTRLYGMVVPMLEEITHVLRALHPIETFQTPFPGGIYLAPSNLVPTANLFLICLQCGIGKSAASSALTWLAARYNVELCFHLGTAGSLSDQLKPTDWVLADSVAHHDVDLTGFGYPLGFSPNNPLFTSPSLNYIERDPDLYARLLLQNKNRFLCHKGQIISGDQFICDASKKRYLQESFPDACAVDMESSAFVQACQTHNIPWLIFRTISDDAGSQEDHERFRSNLDPCSKQLTHFFFEALQALCLAPCHA